MTTTDVVYAVSTCSPSHLKAAMRLVSIDELREAAKQCLVLNRIGRAQKIIGEMIRRGAK